MLLTGYHPSLNAKDCADHEITAHQVTLTCCQIKEEILDYTGNEILVYLS